MIPIILITLVLFWFCSFLRRAIPANSQKSSQAALDLLDLKPGGVLLDLGSGDGKVMRAAASRGLKVVGYEINPILVLISKLTTRKYKGQVKIIWGNFWTAKWPEHDGIYVFLLDKYMTKLDNKIKQESKKGVKVASNTFKIPGKKCVSEKSGIYLYTY